MKLLRKIVALLCAGSMMFGLTACGGGDGSSSSSTNSSTASSVDTSSGDASVETSSEGASAETSSEDASVETSSEDASVETSSEDASVETSSEDVSVETSSEDASVETSSEDVSAETSSEDASVEDSEESAEDSSEEEKPSITLAQNFDVDTALKNANGWEGILTNNPVLDTTNGFLTFRKKSSQAIGYNAIGMSSGTMEFQMKVGITADTTACVVFSNQASKLDDFCYKPGGKSYSLEFSWDETESKGKVFVKKWINAEETVLTGTKSGADVPMTLKSRLTAVKIVVTESANSVNIKAYAGATLLADVDDTTNPILGGGAVGFSYTSTTGVMVIGGKNSTNYVVPEEPKLEIYDAPNVTVADTDIDLMANFATDWTGRERIFNTTTTANGVQFSSLSNPEEPQAGVTEYQAIYTKKIFGDAGYKYDFSVQSHGEWIMFWFKCTPQETTNVSVWGNKSTRENTNGYSLVITADGYVQIHKWADFSQIWLNGQGKKLPGAVMNKFNDPSATITVEMEMYTVQLGGVDVMEFWVKIGDTEITVQDTDTPFLNAGYAGVQGYAIGGGNCAITIKSAEAYAL